jgi:hypothetical protein
MKENLKKIIKAFLFLRDMVLKENCVRAGVTLRYDSGYTKVMLALAPQQ